MQNELPGRLVTSEPPSQAPTYVEAPPKIGRAKGWRPAEVVDGLFFAIGAGFVLWFAWLLLRHGVGFRGTAPLAVIVFWLMLAYIGLPRLQEMLSRIYVPDYFFGRTVTEIGVLGDPVNLALLGTDVQIHEAMTRAGWSKADDVTLRSSWGIIVSSVLRRSYPEAPVSPLLLFDRQQAFAYQQEVDGSASQRHHVRFWPVPDGWQLPGGGRVDWLAAGTYDRAVGLSLFTLQVTHKIDADVDIERDYIVDSVRFAVPEAKLRIIDDFSTAFSSRNGGGDVVRTDGNLPIVDLTALSVAEPVAAGAPTHDVTRRRIPGPALMLAGAFGIVQALYPIAMALYAFASLQNTSDGYTFGGVVGCLQIVAVPLLVVALWVLVLRRHAWARLVLMTLCAVNSAVALAGLSDEGGGDVTNYLSAGLSLLVLIAVSSGAARRWVDGD